ncbi:MAG: DMT family transporter [candidate division Zixibacteria bacterium]|nr:DMT family transporter [Candidatus Tariuqbacter arcticus]
MTNQNRAYLFVAISVLFWSTVASAFKLALRELDFIQVLFFSTCASTLILFLILFLSGKTKQLFQQTPRSLLNSSLLGLINPTLYYLVLFKAYDLLPAQEAQPLNWIWPITLSLLSALLLKQSLGKKSIAGIFISFAGVLVISTRGDLSAVKFTNLSGDLLAVSSAVIWAFYWIFNLKDSRDPVVKLFQNFFFGSIYNAIVLLTLSEFTLSPLNGIFCSIYIGLFEMGITFIVWLKALSLARNSASVANFAYITPLLSLVFIHFIVGETILFSSLAGLFLIIGGILLGAIGNARRASSNHSAAVK